MFSTAVAVSIVRNERPIHRDVVLELAQRFQQLALRVALVDALTVPVEKLNRSQGRYSLPGQRSHVIRPNGGPRVKHIISCQVLEAYVRYNAVGTYT